MLTDKLHIIRAIFSNNATVISCEANRFFAKDDKEGSFQEVCKSQQIQTEKQGEKVFIKTKSFLGNINLACFEEAEIYFEHDFINKNFVILSKSGEYCYYMADTSNFSWSDSVSNQFQLICKNLFSYYQLYNFLISEDFADHHTMQILKLLFTVLQKGFFALHMKYYQTLRSLKIFHLQFLL